MIVGVGTDMVEVARIAALLVRYRERFTGRVLTADECRVFAGRKFADTRAAACWVAKRYAAKEAVAKAFGTGIGGQLSFQDIVIGREDSGRPLLSFCGDGTVLAARLGVVRAHLSLTDEREFALAFVVLESA